MPGPRHGWLMVKDRYGDIHEVINHARTAAYLSNPTHQVNGISPCNVLEFGGCETYSYEFEQVIDTIGWIDLSGTAFNFVGVPQVSAFQITSDLTAIVKIQATDYTPTAKQTPFARWQSSTTLRSWALSLNTAGTLEFMWSNNGTAELTATSTVNIASTVGAIWIAATIDVDNGASGRTIKFWTSTDGTTWTQLGADVTQATATSIYSPALRELSIGAVGTTGVNQMFAGRVYNARLRTGSGFTTAGPTGGTEVFRFDSDPDLINVPADATAFASTSGHMMQVHASTAAPKVTIQATTQTCVMTPVNYDFPAADPAPWYNAAYPESADALGFYIEDWTGLDDRHITRPTATSGGLGGGLNLGSVSSDGRTMALNLFLIGETEEAVDYLYNWLASTLGGVCSSCATDTIMIRRFCGSTANPEYGLGEMRNVGLTRGLGWESDVTPWGNCQIRRASVMLTAGDPCIYLPSTDVPTALTDADADLVGCLDGTGIDPDRLICRPSCSELIDLCRTVRSFEVNPMAAIAPVVTLENHEDDYTYPFRAIVYADPHDIGVTPNPCGLEILGEVYVRALPGGTTIIWDVAGRDIRLRDASTGTPVSSYVYIEPNDPPRRRSFALPCGTAHLVLEPATMCTEAGVGDAFESQGITFDPPRFPTVTVELQERVSCA